MRYVACCAPPLPGIITHSTCDRVDKGERWQRESYLASSTKGIIFSMVAASSLRTIKSPYGFNRKGINDDRNPCYLLLLRFSLRNQPVLFGLVFLYICLIGLRDQEDRD